MKVCIGLVLIESNSPPVSEVSLPSPIPRRFHEAEFLSEESLKKWLRADIIGPCLQCTVKNPYNPGYTLSCNCNLLLN